MDLKEQIWFKEFGTDLGESEPINNYKSIKHNCLYLSSQNSFCSFLGILGTQVLNRTSRRKANWGIIKDQLMNETINERVDQLNCCG